MAEEKDGLAGFDPFGASAAAAPLAPTAPPVAAPAGSDALANYDPFSNGAQDRTTFQGRVGRELTRDVAPAFGGMAAAGAAAPIGELAGFAAGELLFPAGGGIPGAAVGAFLAGGAANLFAANRISAAQTWALNRVPNLRDALGQGEEQRRIDEEESGLGTYLAGFAPYLLTGKPFGAVSKVLPENATTLQRLYSHPWTSRIMSGAIVGGATLGQEAYYDDHVDWNHVAVATAFGMVWNKPTKFGEAISAAGARPVQRLLGPITPAKLRAFYERPPGAPPPTEEELADFYAAEQADYYDNIVTPAKIDAANITGSGVPRFVADGAQERAPEATIAAEDTAGLERAVLGAAPKPSLSNFAKQQEPELFKRLEDLRARERSIRAEIDAYNEVPMEELIDLHHRRAMWQRELDDHIKERGGYKSGHVANQLRAKIREIDSQYKELIARKATVARGEPIAETPERAAIRKRLLENDQELQDVYNEVRAAYRAAADATGARVIEERPIEAPPVEEAPKEGAPPPQPEPAPQPESAERPSPTLKVSIEEQKTGVSRDFTKQLVGAGEDPHVAEALGALAAEYYERQSAIFNGTLGGPWDIYQREGPRVTKGKIGRAKVERKKPSLPENPTRQDINEFLKAGGKLTIAGSPEARRAAKAELPPFPEGGSRAEISAWLQAAGGDVRASRPGLDVREATEETPPPTSDQELEDLKAKAKAEMEAEIEEEGRTLSQRVKKIMRAKITFVEGMRPLIQRMASANASSVLHEFWHMALNDLVRNASHPDAPQWLRNDAESVRRWLGVDKLSDLPDAAHEKFADGGLTYTQTNVAPSSALERVFSRFRDWLMKIIGTAEKAGVPISNEMRAVYGRMLAENPRSGVIGETRSAGPTITEIHAADARVTEPAESEPAMDRVLAEGEQYVKDQPPEIQAELENVRAKQGEGTKPGGENTAGAGGRSEVERPSSVPRIKPSSGGGGAEHGNVVQGGPDPRTTSELVSAIAERATGNGEERPGRNPIAPDAPDTLSDIFPAGDRKLENIIGENLTTVQQFLNVINEVAVRIGGTTDVMSKEMLHSLATQLGKDPSMMDFAELHAHLEGLLGGMRDMPQKVRAARILVKEHAKTVHDAMVKAASTGALEDKTAAVAAIMRQEMMQAALSGATTSWGRTGNAFHNISGATGTEAAVNQILKENTGRTLFQIDKIIQLGAKLDTPEKVARFVNRTGQRNGWGMLLEWWINSILSSVPNVLTYGAANGILTANHVFLETPTAALISRLRGRNPGMGVQFGEVRAGAGGMVEGFLPSVDAAISAARSGKATLLPGEKPGERFQFSGVTSDAAVLREAQRQEVVSNIYGLGRGLKDAFVAGEPLQKAASNPNSPLFTYTPNPDTAWGNLSIGPVNLPLGGIVTLPSKMHTAMHSFFAPLNQQMKIHQLAYREAMRLGAEKGWSDIEIAKETGRLAQNPTDGMMQEAARFGRDQSMMGEVRAFTNALSHLTNVEFFAKVRLNGKPIKGTGLPLLKFVDPFVQVSTNIINQALVQRTPVGLLSPSIRADLLGRNGAARADMAAAKMVVGSAMGLMFGFLAAEGYVTGSEPSDPHERALWRQLYQAHSVRIGDSWYAMNRLGPLGMLASTAADLHQMAHHLEEGEAVEAATAIGHAFTQNILDESFMRGPSDLIKAVDEPGRYGSNYIRNFLTSFVPYSGELTNIAHTIDPYTRQARTMVDAFKAKIPGLSQDLYYKRDIWGEPIPSRSNLGVPGTNVIWQQRVNDDPVSLALLNLQIKPAMPERHIRNVELTEQQYDDWARIAGRMARMSMDRLINSGAYQQAPRGVQYMWVEEALRQSRTVAENMMFMKYPTILSDAYNVKMKRRMGEK